MYSCLNVSMCVYVCGVHMCAHMCVCVWSTCVCTCGVHVCVYVCVVCGVHVCVHMYVCGTYTCVYCVVYTYMCVFCVVHTCVCIELRVVQVYLHGTCMRTWYYIYMLYDKWHPGYQPDHQLILSTP